MSTADYIVQATTQSDEILVDNRNIEDPNPSPVSYQSLSVGKQISKAKFPVYLASSKVNRQSYAMKVFSNFGFDDSNYYKNEIRFAGLKHQNVVNIVSHEENRRILYKGVERRISYVLMEYAPYGDFFQFITRYNEKMQEQLMRTYFRQLIEGLEYLHAKGVAHLDLKMENLLIGDDYNLKIADFDLSHILGDASIIGRGTKFYRGPEMFKEDKPALAMQYPFAADVFSAAVIMFVLKSGGLYPQFEDKLIDGINFEELMYNNKRKFWRKHRKFEGRKRSFYNKDFKQLFNNMVKANPSERFTIDQIKRSRWYNGPVYTPVELRSKMQEIFSSH